MKMPVTVARYDGHADWYEQWSQPFVDNTAVAVRQLIGSGDGVCLDVGCGGGAYLDALAMTGRTVVGLDRSADQLRFARRRSSHVLHGDAAALPFADGAFAAVVAIWISTDVDDFTAVTAEAARVLRPGGLFACYGAHPCFNGPHIEWLDDGVRVHPGYRLGGWHQESPWWGFNVRRRVGMRQHPLAELLMGFISAGLVIEVVDEPGDRPVPHVLAIRARKPASPDARPRARTGPFPA
jgi:SAM-dependent methyltransferase